MKHSFWLIAAVVFLLSGALHGVSDEVDVSGWMKQAPDDWRWDARIAHVKWYPQIIDFPRARDVIADHLAILKSYGFNTACLFGYHYRFDHTTSWEKLEAFAHIVCEEGHRLDMKVIGHHSAVLATPSHHDDTLRIGDALIRDLFPSSLTIGTPPGGPERAAFLCTNNPIHQAAYLGHIDKLMAAGLDGLMTDDLCWWPDPYACVCEHCRALFIERGGIELPPVEATDFWMKRDSAEFRRWINFRQVSIGDHFRRLDAMFDKIQPKPVLLCCNADVTGAWMNTQRGFSMEETIRAGITTNYLEPFCNTAGKYEYFMDWYHQAIDMKVMQAANRSRDIPIWIGWYVAGSRIYLEYFSDRQLAEELRHGRLSEVDFCTDDPALAALTPEQDDQAALIYGLTRTFGDRPWVCFAYHQLAPYMKFDAEYAGLWKRRGSLAQVALVFSAQTRDNYFERLDFDSRKFVDVHEIDTLYGHHFRGWATTLLDENILFDVLVDDDLRQPIADNYKVLIAPNLACLDPAQCRTIRAFVRAGNTLIATGETSRYDQCGELADDLQLVDVLGVKAAGRLTRISDDVDQFTSRQINKRRWSMMSEGMKPQGRYAPVSLATAQTAVSVAADPYVTFNRYGDGRVLYCAGQVGDLGRVRQPTEVEHQRHPEGRWHTGKARWEGVAGADYKTFMARCVGGSLRRLKRRMEWQQAPKNLVAEAYRSHNNSVVVHVLNLSGAQWEKGEVFEFPVFARYPDLPGETTTLVLRGVSGSRALALSPDLNAPVKCTLTTIPEGISIEIPNTAIHRYAAVVIEE